MNPKVDFYFTKAHRWQAELKLLRTIVLDSELIEELKWGVPCYTLDGHNVVLIHTFKEYCAILFVKGSLLQDPKHLLIQQTPNVQAGRHIRFTSVQEIAKLKPVVKSYIREAIKVQQAGLKVPHKKTKDYIVADEFQNALQHNPALKTAFDTLSPGRQHGYLLYFSAPKLSKTRQERVEKSIDQILEGLGLND